MATDTPTQIETYQAVANFEDRRDRLPTIDELAAVLGISYGAALMRCKMYEIELPRSRRGARRNQNVHTERVD